MCKKAPLGPVGVAGGVVWHGRGCGVIGGEAWQVGARRGEGLVCWGLPCRGGGVAGHGCRAGVAWRWGRGVAVGGGGAWRSGGTWRGGGVAWQWDVVGAWRGGGGVAASEPAK